MMKHFVQAAIKQRHYTPLQNRCMFYFAKKVINLPSMGDSITQGGVKNYAKSYSYFKSLDVGDYVDNDEIIAYVETDKITIDIRSPEQGILTKLFAKEGDNVEVGKPFYEIDVGAQPEGGVKKEQAPVKEVKEAKKEQVQTTEKVVEKKSPEVTTQQKSAEKPPVGSKITISSGTPSRNSKKEPMSRMRQRIASRLKEAQNTYALLTTFNECDMSAIMTARESLQKDFQKKHGIKLGFMSFFVKASVHCLQEIPIVNAVIDGTDIVYRDFCDISVAVATPNGLMVPVLRNCETKSFADIEKNLIELANKGKDGKISPDDMVGGTFTISNGGVFGSMMGTPIVNTPQSAILGMHAIIPRPVVRDDQIVARPMMYLALTYDHRIMDGKDAATFLKKLCTVIEDPRRLLLDI